MTTEKIYCATHEVFTDDCTACLREGIKREHELYLSAHRENMKAASLMIDMENNIERLKEQSNAHRDAQIKADREAMALAMECKEKTEALEYQLTNCGWNICSTDEPCGSCVAVKYALRSRHSSSWLKRVEAMERVLAAANNWRTHHVCCPKDCPDLKDAEKRLGDSLDAFARKLAEESK